MHSTNDIRVNTNTKEVIISYYFSSVVILRKLKLKNV